VASKYSVVSVLFRKRTAELSRGYYTRGAEVWPPNRSRHNTKSAGETCKIGMGIVQALLAALTGHIEQFAWSERGKIGWVRLASTSSSREYDFTWDEVDPLLALLGGFNNGPTYQLAVLHLLLCYLDHVHGGSERSAEVMECWFSLVDVMELLYPRRFEPEGPWTKDQIAAACGDDEVRPLIERLSDAMWFTMRYQLPDHSLPREMDLYAEQTCSLPLQAPEKLVQGATLFVRPQPASVSPAPKRRVRRELELVLGEQQVLLAGRPTRLVGAMPLCHFPNPFDEEV
jgi:hypothetical protein